MTHKTILIIIFLFAFILSACGNNPVSLQPTLTETIEITATSHPTTTAIFTPSPTDTQIPNPTATPFIYTSCVDPKLIAEQDASFSARTGIDLSNPAANSESQKFADYVKMQSSVGYDPKIPEIRRIQFVKTGFEMVSAKQLTNGKIDKIICLYGRNNIIQGETFSIAVGWIDSQGTYHPLDIGVDLVTGQDLSIPWQFRSGIAFNISEQLPMIQAIEDGAHMQFEIHTFDQIKSVDQIQTVENSNLPVNVQAVRDFIQMLGNQTLERLGIDNSITSYWDNVDPQEGDVGFIPAGGWIYNDLFSPSK